MQYLVEFLVFALIGAVAVVFARSSEHVDDARTAAHLGWWRFKDWFWGKVGIQKPRALPLRAFSSTGDAGQVIYSWEDWAKDAREAYPTRYFLTETLPRWWSRYITRSWDTAWYWLRTHTYDRYHILDLRNQFYNWGWQDVSEKLLYANFNLLVEFIEGEEPFTVIDWDWDDQRSEIGWEILALYWWWKHDRAVEHAAEDADSDELDERDQLMLHRLIEVRQYLWT